MIGEIDKSRPEDDSTKAEQKDGTPFLLTPEESRHLLPVLHEHLCQATRVEVYSNPDLAGPNDFTPSVDAKQRHKALQTHNDLLRNLLRKISPDGVGPISPSGRNPVLANLEIGFVFNIPTDELNRIAGNTAHTPNQFDNMTNPESRYRLHARYFLIQRPAAKNNNT